MNDATPKPATDPWADPLARSYLAIGLAACVVLALTLTERGVGMWAIVAPLIGAAGLAFRWPSAPVFVILGTAIALMATQRTRLYVSEDPITNVVLAATVLGYCVAQFRLAGLTRSLLPPDPRRTLSTRPRRSGLSVWVELLMLVTIVPYLIYMLRRRNQNQKFVPIAERRSGATAANDEIVRAFLFPAGALATAFVLWGIAGTKPVPLSIIPGQWQLGVIVWLLIVVALDVRVVVSYLAARRMTLIEARMVLADELWRETRREQRRSARWVAWARLRQDARRKNDQALP